MLRRSLPVLVLALTACSTPAPTPETTPSVAEPGSSRPAPEADLLRIEDRREYDRDLLTQWASSSLSERRERAALAIARIGSATFEDLDGNGWQDENEPNAGTSILLALTADHDPLVRAAAAFAFGETGDLRGVEALFALAKDGESNVATAATNAIAKLVPSVPFERYETLLSPDMPPATRLAAIRYLFRFGTERPIRT